MDEAESLQFLAGGILEKKPGKRGFGPNKGGAFVPETGGEKEKGLG